MQVITGGCNIQKCGNDNPCDAPFGCDPLSLGPCVQCSSSNKSQTCVSYWLGSPTCSSDYEGDYCGVVRVLTECVIIDLFGHTQCVGGVNTETECGGLYCTVF